MSPITTTLFAIRHGETEWNREGRQQGHLDSSLTPNGIRQAECLAKGLRHRQIDGIVSSDLGRAVETCNIIARELGLEYAVDSGLRERHLGIIQGLTLSEFAERYPAESERFQGHDADYVIPRGESINQRKKRCIEAATKWVDRHAGKRLLVVGHGGVMMSFICHALGLGASNARKYSLPNAAINSFEVRGGEWKLVSWGETSHLQNLRVLDDR